MPVPSYTPSSPADAASALAKYRSNANILSDPRNADEARLKAAQDISENFEVINSNHSETFVTHAVPLFLKVLQDEKPQFIAESHLQLLRKLILELLHRMPNNEVLGTFVQPILELMFHLIETENEENVLVCLRVIIELHKQYRPVMLPEIQKFLQFVKQAYKDIPHNVRSFLPEVLGGISTPDPLNIQLFVDRTGFASQTIITIQQPDGTKIQQTILPKGTNSLKVLAEYPIMVVLMYQLYKQHVHGIIAEFIPLIMSTIVLQINQPARPSPNFKEMYVDFVTAQIKTLSFLAYIIKIYQEMVSSYATQMVKGILGLFQNCPSEVTLLRKDLLIATRHILATDLRTKFVPNIDKFFDENVLVGKGWTSKESLRPIAYSTLADLVHHVRQHLPLQHLSMAVQLFSKNVHDESLPCNIQTMSCKLLLNLVECIMQKSDQDASNAREILMRMLEVFVLKFQTIADNMLPTLFAKCRQPETQEKTSMPPPPTPSHGQRPPPINLQATQAALSGASGPLTPGTPSRTSGVPTSVPGTPTTTTASSSETPQTPTRTTAPPTTPGVSSTHPLLVAKLKTDQPAEEKPKMYVPSGSGHYGTCSVTDCRSLVKTVVCGVKTITWGISSCKGNGVTQQPVKQLQPRETMVFIKLVKHTLRALDIYQIQVSANGQMTIRPPNMQSVRLKEEKEVLEHFASLFPKMHALTFREIFQTTIDHMVESIYRNYALQIIANSFLANVATSATFATILVEYLLERMEEMGTNQERSNLYLKLFKLVFGSVSLFAAENEQMLKPHLHKIVNRSMELATTAKEPYNYFLLLRALFRSIGGGSHDLLYQEFLPLLPNLLQGLNQLQSGLHKQHMKDLFVELCLTVPVRLSSLLPYLPMLMDPLVSALNGSQILISQGLRTLELCVDNLQPDFLYEHIQPVRADLMQALWRTLRDRNDQIAHVAFRVLGKLGGGNRKMLKEPQRLKYKGEDNQGPCIPIYFAEKGPIHLPVAKVIETALNKLKSPTTEGFYRRQAWEVVRHFIIGMIDLSDDRKAVQQLFQHQGYKNGDIMRNVSLSYKCQDTLSRTCAQQALTAMIVAATIKDLRNHSLPFMLNIVRHFTLVTVAQQAGPLPMCHKSKQHNGLDPHVLIDAIATCMAHEEKELCKPGQVALNVILDTAAAILGSKYRACQLPIFEYVSERMCSCCYERAWYAKLGGCCAIKIMMEKLDRCWVLSHLYQFLKALLFVMLDLTGEVSSGALDMAKTNLANLLKICAKTIEGKDAENKRLVAAQQRAFYEVTRELVKEVTSPNQTVREQAMHSLQSLATLTGKTVTDIMLPHKEVLADMIPPKKHLLRHQPANAQRGLMDSNTFCTTLEPRLFKMNLQIAEHKVFFMELMNLCELEDSMLVKLPCYKSVPSLVPLRVSALKALSACHYIPEARERIFKVLYTALNSTQSELQEAGAEAMKKFIAGHPVEMELIHSNVRPLLLMLGDHRSLNLNMIQRLHSLTELFPDAFSEKLCEQMLAHLKKWLEATIMAQKTGQTPKAMENIKICTAILNIFHAIPAASAKQLETMLVLTGQAEMALSMEAGSPFREPLLKFLLRYPKQSIDLFLVENTLKKQQRSRMLIYFLKQKEAEPLRKVLEANTPRIINLAFAKPQPPARPGNITEKTLLELQYQSIYICRILVKYNPDWLPKQPQLCNHLRRIWISDSFQERHINDNVSISHWNEPKLLAKCLINYAEQHPDNVELVFQLLRVFIKRYMPNFQFVREFIEEKIAKGYVVEQKRKVFFTFVALYMDKSSPQELIAAALQYVIIPMFAASFDKGEGDELIGGPPNPSQNSPDNLVSVFISKVIDPDNPHGTSDALRILLLQFGALLVEKAAPHIHDTADKRQGSKLRRLMTFAWPCLIQKNCVDPTTKYYGHLLLSHTIAKFAIHKKIVLKVFHSLLKAHALEAKGVVRQALDILTPVLPQRMEDGNTMLMHWTKKIIVEEGYTTAQLVHMLQLINRHYKVYYPVRHHLIQTIVYSIQRLGYTQNSTLEHRKLVVDLVEVIIKWELQRIKDEEQSSAEQSGGEQESKRARHGSSSSPATTTKPSNDPNRQVDKVHSDSVVNFLIRLACQVNESGASVGSPGEQLSRRCMGLLKMALRPEVWPLSDLRLSFLDKIFSSIDQPTQINFGNICAGLDVLNFLLTIMDKQAILSSLKPLQRGIVKCMTCDNTKVIRSVHSLLVRLMGIFPTESSTSSIASKFEELETLYAGVGKIIYEGLTAYEKAANGTPTPRLFGTLMILKAACTNNISYIDRLISVFMRALQKMAREHLSPSTTEPNSFASELLVISLDLVKNRVCVMSTEMRRNFVHSVLASLIEKSADAKVLKTIVRMVEEWVKAKTPAMINQSFSPKEKTVLLVKLMQYVEKRFPDEADLNAQFLELVNWVYRDEALAGSELTSKLEPAFLAGLRCPQPLIRAKFFDVFNTSIRRRLFDRLLYIIDSQNWEAMGTHYWLKQCMELVLVVSLNGPNITTINSSQLPAICNVINLADSQEKTAFQLATHVKEEPMETDSDSQKEEDVEIDIEITQPETPTTTTTTTTPSTVAAEASNKPPSDPKLMLQQFLFRSRKFIENLREVKTINFLAAFSQLCHSDTELTNELWIHLFPQIWKILSEKEQATLSQEMGPFLCSGSHHYQKEAPHSVIKTMMEAISKCVPPITIRPCVTKYLGKSHNLWHRSILMLEQSAIESGFSSHHRPKNVNVSVYDFYEPDNAATTQKETLDSLAELYERLEEEDMWAGLWQKRCKFPETATAISFEQQGFFEQAQGCYEQAMTKARAEHNNGPANPAVFPEYQLWENHWIRCSKELSQWDLMMEYGNTKGNSNPHLVLESAWRVPNWNAMKEALAQVELSCPREMNWKVNMYRGFIAICHPEEKNLTLIDKLVEMSSNQAVKEWRRLPTYITQAHMPLLQAAQRIMELQEAAQVHHGLQPTNVGRTQSLHDMKAIVKTWRNRLPMISDDLSHWSDIFMWRQHHYQAIVSAYENQASQDSTHANHAMLGVHASAQSIINYGKMARKHNLIGSALDSLSRIHTIPSVPIVDCFQKIRQQVKCYLQMAGTMGKQELQEGLEVIESTNLKYFGREMKAEFYALKGMFLAQVGRSDEANKAFSAAVQMHDILVKAWALWGNYLEQIFCKDRSSKVGESAIVCFLHACRHQNTGKSRKYLAKVLWLLSYEDDKTGYTLAKAVETYTVGVPPSQWLPWIPQLLTCLKSKIGEKIMNILLQIGKVYPQALYFPIRTLYLTLKIEHREKWKSAEPPNSQQRVSSTLLKVSQKLAVVAANNEPPAAAQNTNDTEKSTTAEPTSTAQTVTTVAASNTVTATTTTSAAVTNVTKATTGTVVAGGTSAVSTTAATTSATVTTTSAAAIKNTTAATTSTSKTAATTSTASGLGASSASTTGPIKASIQMVRCSKIMQVQRDLHPILLYSLEGIVDQMVWFRERWDEEVLRQLKLALTKCQAVAFENRGAVIDAKVTPHTHSFVKKLVKTFGVGFENVNSVATTFSTAASELWSRRVQATAQDPIFQKLKTQFTTDFNFDIPGAMKLHNLIGMLKKWVKVMEARSKLGPKSFLIEDKCRFLSNFSSATADVELPGEFLTPKHSHYNIRIARFMPRAEIVHKHNTAARRLYIRGSNGKIYPYLVVNDASMGESRREERVLQLLRMLNQFLAKRKETAKRQLQFTVPKVVAVSPQMRLVEDSPSSISLLDIYKEWSLKHKVEFDAPISKYYDRLAVVQSRGSQVSHQVLRDILKDVQSNMVPRSMLKEWAMRTFPTATDYFSFRKMFTGQLALLGLAEFILHLTRLNPEILQVERNSGLLSVFYFKFDIDDSSGELDANRPVPFRLTPNVAEFLTTVGVNGVLTASMIATARCLVQPSFQLSALLKAILRDEIIAWDKKKREDTSTVTDARQIKPEDIDCDLLITTVTKAVGAIMTRLQNLAQFEGGESKVSTLVAAANSPDNLCRMDPAWHPWL